ncbi:MAG: tRNA (adenosine(37)-N6)-dimethylallyltransferase MiaA, partial [Candidatus Cloacimonetes bacterium]|nr:tRNA (adenosine(37)-N6)-dimethylallyltransferase MiaA [Candidatus Cloacimonadota bacterium]
MPQEKIPLITIQGPTASGKSDLAVTTALTLGTEIISADSRQVYRFLDIGTAKPTPAEQKIVNHHLIDIINPDERYNAGRFAGEATTICHQLWEKGRIPLVVGGTGFYIKSLLNGLARIPEIPVSIKQKFQTELDNLGLKFLYERLQKTDAFTAARIQPNDRQRILRALEVQAYTGKPISSFWKEQQQSPEFISFNILLQPERNMLYSRIDQRLDQMLQAGLLDEISSLLEKGYNQNDPGLKTVGYQEFLPCLLNDHSLDDCLKLAKQHSRNYAKRQITWYKKVDFNLTITANKVNFSKVLKS